MIKSVNNSRTQEKDWGTLQKGEMGDVRQRLRKLSGQAVVVEPPVTGEEGEEEHQYINREKEMKNPEECFSEYGGVVLQVLEVPQLTQRRGD